MFFIPCFIVILTAAIAPIYSPTLLVALPINCLLVSISFPFGSPKDYELVRLDLLAPSKYTLYI